ncbi:hypothetical protein BGZ51_000185 [Haplosporangium sp. Z 767]|nr:hypothetical protein BGZ51_000185 [Haplosporangium sp. Z 767]
MPANHSPVPARRGSMRTRIAANNSSNQSSASLRQGPVSASSSSTTTTRAQLQARQSSPQQSEPSSASSTSTSALTSSTIGRQSRPRREAATLSTVDADSSRKQRRRHSKGKEPTPEISTPPISGTSSMARDDSSPTRSSVKDMDVDMDPKASSSRPVSRDRRFGTQKQSIRRSVSAASKSRVPALKHTSNSNNTSNSSNNDNGSGSNSSAEQSKTSERNRNRVESNSVSEDRDVEDASSESDGEKGDAESDDDHQAHGSSKEKVSRTTKTPPKRRLRSSRLIPNVVAHLATDDILAEYTDEQQELRANISAAEALTRLFRKGIEGSESLHPDMVEEQDYELIRHAFGEIEDLSLNLTGVLPTEDESSVEDDELTKDLKREHRSAKTNLYKISTEYKEMQASMVVQMFKDLDTEEAQIKAGTHPGLLAELKAIEERRRARISVVKARKDYLQRMWEHNFQASRKAANDQYRVGQVAARRTIIDLVQNRMNRIKQEMAQSNKAEAKSLAKRRALARALSYRQTTLATGYNSCGDSCSSYDSYSSSGSECSDCEICQPKRRTGATQLTSPKGLSRKEVEVDLAFLFPEPTSRTFRHRPSDPSGVYSYYGQEFEDPSRRRGACRNQQHLIDQLNEEKKRKRRVLEREIQHSMGHKQQTEDDRDDPRNDMNADVDLDFDASEREGQATSRSHSPIRLRSSGHANARSSKASTDRQPRFLPGFGPNGMRNNGPVAEPANPTSRPIRYPISDSQGRLSDPRRTGASSDIYTSVSRDDIRPYSLIERESARMRGVRPPQDSLYHHRNGHSSGTGQDLSHYLAQDRFRLQERQDHASGPYYGPDRPPPRMPSPRQSYLASYPMDPRAHPNYIKPPRKRPPPPPEPADYYNPRGRPLKSARVIPWAGPVPNSRMSSASNAAYPGSPSTTPDMSPRLQERASYSNTSGQGFRMTATGTPPGGYLSEAVRFGHESPFYLNPNSSRSGLYIERQTRGHSPAASSIPRTLGSPSLSAVSRPVFHSSSRHPESRSMPASPELSRRAMMSPTIPAQKSANGPAPPKGTISTTAMLIDLSSPQSSPLLEPRKPVPCATDAAVVPVPKTRSNGVGLVVDQTRVHSPTRIEVDLTEESTDDPQPMVTNGAATQQSQGQTD